MKKIRTINIGFTLVELVFVAGILALCIAGMMQLFIQTGNLTEISGNKTMAVAEAQGKMEEIRNHTYDSIASDYASGGKPGNSFDTTMVTGKGAIYVDSSNAELLVIKVAVCWQNRNGQVIGEDVNLNGVLDTGEDLNSNSEIDSEVILMSMVTRR